MIKEFIRRFTEEEIIKYEKTIKVSQEYYLVNEKLKEMSRKIGRQPVFIGKFLGKEKKEFKPSISLLQDIAEKTEKKVIIDDKMEWLFICGRKIRAEEKINGDVMVLNKFKECIGYGISDGNSIKNIFDVGDLLRREK